MELSERVRRVTGSITIAIDAKAKSLRAEGEDVIGFGAGEPDFNTPAYIVEAAKAALDAGHTRYTPCAGTVALREAVCHKFLRDNLLEYGPGNILVSDGAKHSLYNAMQALLDPGDEVLIAAPYWVSYPEMVRMADGVPVFVPTRAEEGYVMSREAMEAAITEKTKLIILNSPGNPTGAVYDREALEQVAQVAIQRDLAVISDEIYEDLIYDGKAHISIASLPGMKERTLVINGMSKAYAMTGWRIGFMAGPREWIKAMDNFQSHSTSCANSIAQYASVAALWGDKSEVADMRRVFENRRDRLLAHIDAIEGVSAPRPSGAFYVMMDISQILGRRWEGRQIDGSMSFADALLEAQKVAVVPGISFGADSCVRLSYATSEDNIDRGLTRIGEFVSGLED